MSVENSLEEGICVFPPNKPLELNLNFSAKPNIYDPLIFIDFNEKGESIVGSSNLNSTFWEGALVFFKNSDRLLNLDYTSFYIQGTASDAKFINDTTIALAEDTGVLTILTVDERLEPIYYFRHLERIPQLAVWDNSSKILSCCARNITIWDIDCLDHTPNIKFDNYHLDAINSVDVLKEDKNLFVTASSDRKSCIWDIRSEKPTSVLYSNEFSALKSIAWNQTNSNYIAIGTQAGDVYLVDRREPNDFVSVQHCFDRSIHKIIFNRKNKVAVCGDTNEIIVFDCDGKEFKEENRSADHKGFVRGLSWQENTLYSCGFDKCILKHN